VPGCELFSLLSVPIFLPLELIGYCPPAGAMVLLPFRGCWLGGGIGVGSSGGRPGSLMATAFQLNCRFSAAFSWQGRPLCLWRWNSRPDNLSRRIKQPLFPVSESSSAITGQGGLVGYQCDGAMTGGWSYGLSKDDIIDLRAILC